MTSIAIKAEYGRATGFVADAESVQLRRYLESQTNLADAIIHEVRIARVKLAVLEHLDVDSYSRQQGIGSLLYRQFEEQARDLGAEYFLLVVGAEIKEWDLEQWYGRRGYERTALEADTGPFMAKPGCFSQALN